MKLVFINFWECYSLEVNIIGEAPFVNQKESAPNHDTIMQTDWGNFTFEVTKRGVQKTKTTDSKRVTCHAGIYYAE